MDYQFLSSASRSKIGFLDGKRVLGKFCLGVFVSTVILHQFTFAINSIAHTVGRRDYETRDYKSQ